uniref:Uncharacterized protein n=1 Tax=Klebsiella pneumoniae TaxID=573 RepID=A0A330KX43_KLEPN|nr:hypothetical protein PCNR341_0065 [Klebsiella pneumoniae]
MATEPSARQSGRKIICYGVQCLSGNQRQCLLSVLKLTGKRG